MRGFPQAVFNPPGLASIDYRIGDYLAFRAQLLRTLSSSENELSAWRPSANGDLALQMMEWWAYVADILTFYNERIANEAYLRTARLPESVNHLVQLLGYRPRPALGATGLLAALLSHGARLPVHVPAGLQIQSKPGPGQAPQVFEVDKTTSVGMPDVVIAHVQPSNLPLLGGDGATLWLAGKVTGLKPADRLLLINAQALKTQKIVDFAWISVKSSAPMSDPLGNAVTQVAFTMISGAIVNRAQAADYVLLRSAQSSPLWTYPNSPAVFSATTIELASIARGIAAGSLLLVDIAGDSGTGGISTHPRIVASYKEVIWYANGAGPMPPVSTPPGSTPAIAIPHAEIGFDGGRPQHISDIASLTPIDIASSITTDIASPIMREIASPVATDIAPLITVRWGWSPVGQLAPVLGAADYVYPTGGSKLVVDAASKSNFHSNSVAVFMEDQAGNAAQTTLTPVPGTPAGAKPGGINPSVAAGFSSPIEVFYNLLPVSRGKTVPTETLGSGNPVIAAQDFVLSKSPVTYFSDSASMSGDNFSSTVHISVNGVRWTEVRNFYGQAPNAQVYVLREDDEGRTHATFGDGINGARLPTGFGNVVATYRYGAGGTAPAAETLRSVLTPTPGLKGVRNPLRPTGGADADTPHRLSSLAPKSVLTFNRAVAIDDYATIAASVGGVAQAAASFAFDPRSQRPMVTLWVAGDDGAVAAAAAALAAAGATMRNVKVLPAIPVVVWLSLTYLRDARYDEAMVKTAVFSALLDRDAGLLGANVLGIGQTIYDSQISAACLSVPGVTAIQDVQWSTGGKRRTTEEIAIIGRRFRPSQPATKGCTGHRHDPGAGHYFLIPDDNRHLSLNGAVAS